MKEKLHREYYAISSRDMALGRAYVLGEDISRFTSVSLTKVITWATNLHKQELIEYLSSHKARLTMSKIVMHYLMHF